jgi:hypothetical protein
VPIHVRGQGTTNEIKLFNAKRFSKPKIIQSILMRDGEEVVENINEVHPQRRRIIRDNDYVETRNVEIQ